MNVEIGTEALNSFSGDIRFEFSVLCLWSLTLFYGRQESAVQGLPREEVIRVVREALLPLQQDFNQKGQKSRLQIFRLVKICFFAFFVFFKGLSSRVTTWFSQAVDGCKFNSKDTFIKKCTQLSVVLFAFAFTVCKKCLYDPKNFFCQ